MHEPVLLKEVLKYLDPKPGEFIVDGTVDGGGHARAIKPLIPGGIFLGLDWDDRMIAERKAESELGRERNIKSDRIKEVYIRGNYADLPEILEGEKLGRADGLLLDLGFSSEQLSDSGRGFSFSKESENEPLLMTYDEGQKPVREILRDFARKRNGESELADIIYKFGGERMSRRIAKAIVEAERRAGSRGLETVGELAAAVRGALPGNYERGRIDPATRTFMALRIYANDELGNVKKILENLENVLKPGGRAVVISFHSLEDRIVKEQFRTLLKENKLEILTKKPVAAEKDEVAINPRSRSAKLRAGIIK